MDLCSRHRWPSHVIARIVIVIAEVAMVCWDANAITGGKAKQRHNDRGKPSKGALVGSPRVSGWSGGQRVATIGKSTCQVSRTPRALPRRSSWRRRAGRGTDPKRASFDPGEMKSWSHSGRRTQHVLLLRWFGLRRCYARRAVVQGFSHSRAR